MKKTTIVICAAAALLLCACAKEGTVGKNEFAKLYLDSWVTVQKEQHPEYVWRQSSLGCWILAETPGTGSEIGDGDDFPYIRYDLTTYDLEGNVQNTTSAELAKKLNTYSPSYYYGPTISIRAMNNLYAGVEDLFKEMRVGGYMKALIPGWLMTAKRYSSAQKYIDNVTGTNTIYEFKVVEVIEDIEKWEIDSLNRYVAEKEGLSPADTVKYGFYYIQEKAPSTTEDMPSDTTVYINYTGRLLNGQVFDTTIERVAKDNDIYSSSRSYKPVRINWASESEDITMGTSNDSVVDGFSYMLSLMKPYEKGRAIFWSGLGYKYNGSGSSIPAWSPLIFEIELVDEQ